MISCIFICLLPHSKRALDLITHDKLTLHKNHGGMGWRKWHTGHRHCYSDSPLLMLVVGTIQYPNI